MKLTLFVALLSCQCAVAQTDFFPLLKCNDRTYTNATIDKITPATVDVSWDGGGARIPITNLPPRLQARYHYNQRKAQKYLDRQASDKAAQQERENQEATALATAQNTLGPAQSIRILTNGLFPNSLQIESEGVLSEAYIPNLPPEILTFIAKLGQATRTDAASLKRSAQRIRLNAKWANNYLAESMYFYDSNYQEQNIQAKAAQNDARDAELKSADADALLQKLEAQERDRTTILARPTGKMITPRIRQWQFQAMAVSSLTDK